MFRDLALLVSLLLALSPIGASAAFRYEPELNLIVVERDDVATLSGIKAALPQAPLRLVDPARHIWLLSANLLVSTGSTLRLYGSTAGGDVDELRLKSDNSGPNPFVSVTADYGFLDLRATRVLSWDSAANGPDRDYGNGRAFIRARSRMRAMVLIPLQSRMDIVDSDVGFLGYDASESYGLVWKVVAPESFVFDYVRVYGNILRSRLHDNYFGAYASGARGGTWRDNEVFHNVVYGLAPHTRSDDLRIENNDVHHNGNHGITVRQQCLRPVIRDNRVWGNGESGISLHRRADYAQVTGNRVFHNGDAGILLYDSVGATVRDNTVRDNAHIGIQIAMEASGNRVEHNQVSGNALYGVWVGRGRGRPAGGGDGQPRRNQIAHNIIEGSGTEDLRTDPGLNYVLDNVFPGRVAAVAATAQPAAAPATRSAPAP